MPPTTQEAAAEMDDLARLMADLEALRQQAAGGRAGEGAGVSDIE